MDFQKLTNFYSDILELKYIQNTFLEGDIIFEDIDESINSLNSDDIKIDKMSIANSLKNTGKITLVKDKSLANEMCIICFEKYHQQQEIRTLNCGHNYHKECIDTWLYPKYYEDLELDCPLCRQDTLHSE